MGKVNGILLANIAEKLARKPFHGNGMGLKSNLQPIAKHFYPCSINKWDNVWCAAFVYHCCIESGFKIPFHFPTHVKCNFAGVSAWIDWAKIPSNNFYYSSRNPRFNPRKGDIIIFDNIFIPEPHDHIAIILSVKNDRYITAEGNVNNVSAVLSREKSKNVRGFIRIPDNYKYKSPLRAPLKIRVS